MKLRPGKYSTLIFDLESDGLLDEMTTIHVLCIREYETGQVWTFRRNKREDTIAKGVEMLMQAQTLVGHNIAQFDIPAIQIVYPWFDPQGLIRDTLVMSRLIFTDIKDKDFRLWNRGKLPGNLIGTATLKAWGYRLGLQKGDYMDDKLEEAKSRGILDPKEQMRYVWASWNQPMEDYCELDVDVTTKLWTKILDENYPEFPIEFEHDAHQMAIMIEDNGFPFDVRRAHMMAEELEAEIEELSQKAIEHFGFWYAPAKRHQIAPRWDDPDGKQKAKKYPEPREEYGEDYSRSIWAEVTVAKQTRKFKEMYKVNKKTGEKTLNNSVEEGAMYCSIVKKDFNPGSRDNIVDRLNIVYGWEPIDFTDTGGASVDDTVLNNLAKDIPIAKDLAEIFYLKKRLGQVKTGAQAWLNHVKEDGAIHHRLNVGGTISGRCSHSYPNIAQVPKVMAADCFGKDGSPNPKVFDGEGNVHPWAIIVEKKDDGTPKKAILKDRMGRHGYNSRRLFYVPAGWTLVGCDLSGIELRCLANLAAPYDNGYLINQILEGDIHSANQKAAGLETRDMAKTFIYALIYGAGDAKIGSIAKPLASTEEQKRIGKELKEQFFQNLPGLAKVVDKIKKQAKRGWVEGLDGRRLIVRGQHAALNLRLQSDGAVIAKKWMLTADDKFLDAGLRHGWDGDYAFLAFVHDELQVAVRNEYVEDAKRWLIEAAREAGEFFHFAMEVDAEAKSGINWAETH